jgi:hypothetical protein
MLLERSSLLDIPDMASTPVASVAQLYIRSYCGNLRELSLFLLNSILSSLFVLNSILSLVTLCFDLYSDR